MDLGLFFMPLHRPDKPPAEAYNEDRALVLVADRLGFAEAWMGEHFTTAAEPVASPLMFFATLLSETTDIRFGTGVLGLGVRHPVVIAAEAAQFDHLSGGRLLLGVGPGGLRSDAELFTAMTMDQRVEVVEESLATLRACWSAEAPFDLSGERWSASLVDEIWPSHGVGRLLAPVQQPHPPLAMAMVSPGGRTAELIARESLIPISSNFVPIENVDAQWQSYEATRIAMGLDADRSIWRVCRNILVTESQQQADEIVTDPDGVFAFYFRYLRGVAQMPRLRAEYGDASPGELDELLGVSQAIEECVIAGTAEHVTERLIEVVDLVGPFGTLVAIGHDAVPEHPDLWTDSLRLLAEQVRPAVATHMASSTIAGRVGRTS